MLGSGVRFTYRPAIETELKRSSSMYDGLEPVASQISNAAKQYAPVRTGRLRSSITVARSSDTDGNVIPVVTTSVPYAGFVEWGTTDTPASHPLAQGLAAVQGSIG